MDYQPTIHRVRMNKEMSIDHTEQINNNQGQAHPVDAGLRMVRSCFHCRHKGKQRPLYRHSPFVGIFTP